MQLVFAKMYVILKRYYSFFFFLHEFRKRGKNGNKKRGKGKKRNFKKRKQKQEPRLVQDVNC